MNQGIWILDSETRLQAFDSNTLYMWITRYDDCENIEIGRLDFHHTLTIL